MKSKDTYLLFLIITGLILVLLNGCISNSNKSDNIDLENIKKTTSSNSDEKTDTENNQTKDIVEKETLYLITSNLPPFAIESSADGIVVDFAKEIAKKSNMHFSLEFQPWARAQETVSNGKNLVILPLGRIASREEKFNWIGEAMNYNISFLSVNDQRYDLESAKSLNSVLVQQNTTFEAFLQENEFRNIKGTTDTESNGKMLSNGRGNAWFVSEWEGLWIWKNRNLKEKITIGPPIMNTKAWVAVSKDSDKEFVDTITKALNEVLEENVLEDIVDKYTK